MAAFGSMRESPSLGLARQIVEWLGKRPKEKQSSFTQRDVHRGMQSTFAAAADIAPILTVLEAHGYIRALPAPERSPKGGRAKSPGFAVHPDLFKNADTTDRTP